MRRFSCVVPSLTRHSYSDFESVQSISSRLILRTSLVMALRAPVISKPSTIAYNSEASTLLVTLLHLTEVQCNTFAWLSSESTMMVPICDERSLLFANEASVKTSSLSLLLSSGTNFRPLARLSICYYSRLFRSLILLSLGLITYAANERLKDDSGWQTNAIYAPLARYITYCSFRVKSF